VNRIPLKSDTEEEGCGRRFSQEHQQSVVLQGVAKITRKITLSKKKQIFLDTR
jgi:hypothetical protein